MTDKKRMKWDVMVIPTGIVGKAGYFIYSFEGTAEEALDESARLRGISRPFIVETLWVRETDLICVFPSSR